MNDSATHAGLLTPQLEDLLSTVAEPAEREQYRRFLEIASNATNHLGDIEMSDFDVDAILLWETLEPYVVETRDAVTGFVHELDSLFTMNLAGPPIDATLDAVFLSLERRDSSESSRAAKPEGRKQAIYASLETLCQGIKRESELFDEGLNKPFDNADRWSLFSHVFKFRGRFRAAISAISYLLASFLGDVDREHVVPTYAEDADRAVAVRSALARLTASVKLHRRALAETEEAADMRRVGTRMLDAIRECEKNRAFVFMRSEDKRSLLSAKSALRGSLRGSRLDVERLSQEVSKFEDFVNSLNRINDRAILKIHDHDTVAKLLTLLGDMKQSAPTADGRQLRTDLMQSIELLERLVGRDSALDGLITIAAAMDVAAIDKFQIAGVASFMERTLLERWGKTARAAKRAK